jgi:hypothetical protein
MDYGYCLESSDDLRNAIAVQSESIEISEAVGAGFLEDAAGVGLVEAIAKLVTTDRQQISHSVATLRTAIEAALERRSLGFVAGYLAAVEQLLWTAGDHRTALLLHRFATLRIPSSSRMPSVVDTMSVDADTLADIDVEAANLDLEKAAATALVALDEILTAPG